MRCLFLALLLAMSGCGVFGEQLKDGGLKAAKCVTRCAIRCGAEGAIEAARCFALQEDQLKEEAIKAAQCLTQCAIGCGVQAAEAGLEDPPSE